MKWPSLLRFESAKTLAGLELVRQQKRLGNTDLDGESAVEVAQNWITAKNRRKVTKRALQTMMSADDIQETDAFADEQELCDEVEIDKFVL